MQICCPYLSWSMHDVIWNTGHSRCHSSTILSAHFSFWAHDKQYYTSISMIWMKSFILSNLKKRTNVVNNDVNSMQINTGWYVNVRSRFHITRGFRFIDFCIWPRGANTLRYVLVYNNMYVYPIQIKFYYCQVVIDILLNRRIDISAALIHSENETDDIEHLQLEHCMSF